ncbi:glutathione S-transferase [Mycena leptocephala]|nr:glutathione S-transferase [Mycena leptocephala]
MVLKLHGMAFSTCTRRVAIVLLEKKVPFQFVPISAAKTELKSAAHLEKQPFGEVPYIDDDGFILYESRAICRYIADKYTNQGTPLIPMGIEEKALFEQAASIEYCTFEPLASKAVAEMVFKPILGQVPDKAVFDSLIESLSAKLDAYEVILAKHKYLAGNEVTLADLFHLPYATMLARAGSEIMTTKGPNVTRWFNDISGRASWQLVKNGDESTTSYD